MEFETFYFYTNQRALKNYLVNYKIEPVAYRNESNMTLSDLGQNYLLFWKNGIDANVVMKHCKSDNSDVPVVLKVSLPSDRIVEAFFPNDNIKTVKIADCASAYAVKIVYPITFFNVSDIFYIDKQIQFLQGDTTLIIPKQLFKKEAYKISEGLNDSIVNCVIKSFSKPEEGSLLEDEDDEAELNINILSDYTCENDVEKNIREASQKEDRIIAAKLMFIQGKTPYDGSFTPRLHSVIDRCGIPFDKIIYDNFYKNVLPDIVSNNIRYLSGNDDFYIAVLTGRKTDEVYAPAISAILQNNYSYDDKERFLNDYLVRIDASSREQIKEVFADRRARNRIRLLLNDNPKLVPIYFLYTFFDYRLDRFCDNIIVTSIVGGGNNYNYGVKIDIAMNGTPKCRDFRSTEIDNIRIGMTLWHNFYGIGNVINMKKEANETYVTLLFGDVEKTFASSLSLGKYLFTFDCIPPVEYMPEEYKLPDTYQPREMQKQQRDIDNDDKHIERFNSMFDYDGDVYDAGRVVHFDDLEDFEDYDGLIDSGDTSMDYDDYD